MDLSFLPGVACTMRRWLSQFYNFQFPSWLVYAFFGLLVLSRIALPIDYVFDETHYVPASQQVWQSPPEVILNLEHPPLAKYILGSVSAVFSSMPHKLGVKDLFIYRSVCALFSLGILWVLERMLRIGNFNQRSINAALLLTGFNMLWFVQAKTVMLEPFYVFFALAGCVSIFEKKNTRGWLLLGAALATKWSALPFVGVAFLLQCARHDFKRMLHGCLLLLGAYYSLYNVALLPLGATHFGADFIQQHFNMHALLGQTNTAQHPYASRPWQWPLLNRPMWYHFQTELTHARCVMALLNPAVAYVGFVAMLLMSLKVRFKNSLFVLLVALLYWLPLLFWLVIPRSSQYFYYYYAPSLMLGPALVWIDREYLKRASWILPCFVLISAGLFFFFMPILDGRLIPIYDFQQYMWRSSWR